MYAYGVACLAYLAISGMFLSSSLALTGGFLALVAAIEIGTERATTGPPHEAAGLLTYVVACGLMLALGGLLRRLERSG